MLSACAEGFFGVNCELICNCQSTLERCHPITGDCASNCRTGYAGPGCQLRKQFISAVWDIMKKCISVGGELSPPTEIHFFIISNRHIQMYVCWDYFKLGAPPQFLDQELTSYHLVFLVRVTIVLLVSTHCFTESDFWPDVVLLRRCPWSHFTKKLKKVKADIALPRGNPTSELRDVTCHMGSHSVTCHRHKWTCPT